MGILTNSQLTGNFSAKYQLTTSIFLANSQLTTNFGFHFPTANIITSARQSLFGVGPNEIKV